MNQLAYGAVAIAALLAAAIAGWMRVGPETAPDYSRTPVLFVHGHGLSSDDWGPLRQYFLQHGYPPEYLLAIDIRPSRLGNKSAAEQFIRPGVETLLARAAEAARAAGHGSETGRVDIVAHSMGAFSSRWYAANDRPDRVRRWLSIAGANHGTNALCEHRDAGAADMCPAFAGTGIQRLLNGAADDQRDETPFGRGADPVGVARIAPDQARAIAYFTIRIEPDEWIVPARSAVLRGAGGVTVELPRRFELRETSSGNFRSFRELDHMSILNDEGVLALSLAILSASSAEE